MDLKNVVNRLDECGFVLETAKQVNGMRVLSEVRFAIVNDREFEVEFGQKPLQHAARYLSTVSVKALDSNLRVVNETVWCFQHDLASQLRSIVAQLDTDVDDEKERMT